LRPEKSGSDFEDFVQRVREKLHLFFYKGGKKEIIGTIKIDKGIGCLFGPRRGGTSDRKLQVGGMVVTASRESTQLPRDVLTQSWSIMRKIPPEKGKG